MIAGLPWYALVLVALATYRTARIFTVDSIAQPWITWLYAWAWDDNEGRAQPQPNGPLRTYVYELFSCPYCLGVWIAAVLWALARYGCTVTDALLFILAAAGVQTFLQSQSEVE